LYKVSTRGYNNRLYYLRVKAPSTSEEQETAVTTGRDEEEEYIIKICGRYWHRIKTETEVVGKTYAHLPTPMICEWDADGRVFGVEYTVMPKLPGVPLNLIWKDLARDQKRDMVQQLAQKVIQFKAKIPHDIFPQGKIGNWVAVAETEEGKANKLVRFDVGPILEGDEPWGTYKAYYRTELTTQLKIARRQKILQGSSALWPRVEILLDHLDKDDTGFVFTHGDLDAQNLLIRPDASTITAILDWERSGMFPAEDEYFISYGFLGNIQDEDSDLPMFYDLLEQGGVLTPRTIPHYGQRKLLYDIKENIAPWFLLDHSEPDREKVQTQVKCAAGTVESCLRKLGY
jgi:hypothetical protein